ncbi:MAG: hypothetical protein J6D52_12440 [Clostridia bacterium]|nr:hypothetical protein [Clostridia bacterium]
MKKKVLTAAILTFAAITLVVVTVFTTVALLSASSAVSNVFTIGEVKIEMLESKVDSNTGLPDPSGAKTDGNSYHLKPGLSYTKDPTIYIRNTLGNGGDTMYLFVKSNNQIRNIEAGNNGETALTMRKQMEANGWVEFVQSGDGMEIVWVYGTRDSQTGIIRPRSVGINSKQIGADGQELTGANAGEFRLCEEFTIAQSADITSYAAAKVNFTAYAIQDSGILPEGVVDEKNNIAKYAWTALKNAYDYEGGIVNPKNPYNGATGDDAYEPVPGNVNP